MDVPSLPDLLLASQSPRRRKLLTLLGIPFDVAVADVEEKPRDGERPVALATRLSREKALAVDADAKTIILACDTIVALEDEILGKPRDEAEAADMLRRLRNDALHAVYSAVTLRDERTGRLLTDVAKTDITMRLYTEEELVAYVASGDPLDKAGAYAIQHPGFHPVAAWGGCYANVVGLPLCHVVRALRAWGFPVLQDVSSACQAHTGQVCRVYGEILDKK